MLVAEYVVFPIPFFILAMLPPFYVVFLVTFRLILGVSAIRYLLSRRDQVVRFAVIIASQTTPAVIYPVYEMAFRRTEGTHYQFLVILLLPVIKLAVKNIVLRCSAEMEDMVPQTVIFTADYFNAIYIATCMQSASSFTTISAMILVDLLQTSIMLYGLHRRTNDCVVTFRQAVDSAITSDNLLVIFCWLCQNPQKLAKQDCVGIRRRSCLPHRISRDGERVLESLERAPNMAKGLRSQSTNTVLVGPKLTISPLRKVSSAPSRPTFSLWKSTRAIFPSSAIVQTRKDNILRDTLELLFTTECLVTTVYLETIVPFFYCSYMLVMVHLQSAQYHTEMAQVTRENVATTVFPVFMFGLLQIASFWVLAVVIKRNCGIRALYQLAFMLETQMILVQSKLIFWLIVMLCFRVKHFGVDFSFQFI
ncbi:hypothetical protein PR003_g20381 [Phytophthora rubi]|uniref:Uncharacterized protein n=1 Tax=Phytophthora rubi TaxID=129364 RepID=A0A6A4DR87_9STRA|nr:hypothetical protein PR001_g23815 [Phytophthora rubi]KAE9309943.1 hypothetical protein PR003_g20381 [Phytophthora rubi]